MANLLSLVPNSWPARVHYAAMPIAAMAIGSVRAVAWLPRPGLRRAAVGWMFACCLASSSAWGVSRFSLDYESGFWPLHPDPVNATRDDAVDMVPEGAATASSYNIAPHLTHRSEAYTFPSPWQPHNWGVAGEDLPSPSTVDWLVVDRAVTSAEHQGLLDEILASGEWNLRSELDGVVVAERVNPSS